MDKISKFDAAIKKLVPNADKYAFCFEYQYIFWSAVPIFFFFNIFGFLAYTIIILRFMKSNYILVKSQNQYTIVYKNDLSKKTSFTQSQIVKYHTKVGLLGTRIFVKLSDNRSYNLLFPNRNLPEFPNQGNDLYAIEESISKINSTIKSSFFTRLYCSLEIEIKIALAILVVVGAFIFIATATNINLASVTMM